MFQLFILFFFFADLSANPDEQDEINHAIDQIISRFEMSKTFDPMVIPEHVEKFERHIGILDFKGDLTTKNMETRGLSQLKRRGNAIVKHCTNVTQALVNLELKDKGMITVESDASFHLGNLHPRAHVLSYIKDFQIMLGMEIDNQNNFTLTLFEINEMKKIKYHISGLSILNPIFSLLSDIFGLLLNDFFRSVLTDTLAPAFKRELEKLDY